MDKNERYRRAKERVEEIKSFYSHLFVYIIVNLALFLINILTAPDSLWFYWPLFGWGIGLLIHGFTVFGTKRLLRDWEERKIEELMGEDKNKEK
ncbi:2TM domain-containing protein [candidate division WOR-3 bacterium]|nr:2TM domain-containing protein [candidate division WOR-3 bacterium]